MRCFIIILFAALFPFSGTVCASDTTIGTIQTLKGRASIERQGDTIQAISGQYIFVNDIIRTKDGSAMGILFKDNTILSLGPNSEFTISEFVFIPKDRKLSMILKMAKGTVEYIAGTIGRLAPESVQFQTPLAILGIRGTRFLAKIEGY